MYYRAMCPECGGNLVYNSAQHLRYVSCLQCDFQDEVREPTTEPSTPFLVLYHKKSCKGVIDTGNWRGWLCTACGDEGDFQVSRDKIDQMVIPSGFVSSPRNLPE